MKENYQNLVWHKCETVAHQYPLSEEEKLELGRQMAEARAEIARLGNELSVIKKDYKEKIGACEGQLSKAAFKYNSGLSDAVDVECDVYQDFDNEEMVYVSRAENSEIFRRPMDDSEKRPNLFRLMDENKSNVINFRKN